MGLSDKSQCVLFAFYLLIGVVDRSKLVPVARYSHMEIQAAVGSQFPISHC